jgi:tripeptide aminopeptidase
MTKINEPRALKLVTQLMGIRGASCQERDLATAIVDFLQSHGVADNAITYDTAHKRTPARGAVGNLIVKLPGNRRQPRVMLSAHMDTVPICVGCKPKRIGDTIVSADRTTGLGADDRAGVAAILIAALESLESKASMPPLTLCFFVQEEIGLQGSRHLNPTKLGNVAMAFNFDGSSPSKLTIGATGGERMKIILHGLAAHAGLAPQAGASAIHAAGLAIASLHRDGWLGAVRKGKRLGTSNIGVIQGGAATNVVCDRVDIQAEARSHDGQFRDAIATAMCTAFEVAAAQVHSTNGTPVRTEIQRRVDYESFRLADTDPVVTAAVEAVKSVGGQPIMAVSNGGVDANWLVRHGIPTVTLGCGQRDVHTTSEKLDIPDFLMACRIAKQLITHAT